MLKTRPGDFSLSHLKLDGMDVLTGPNDGRIWDNAIKSMVVPIPPPSEKYIAVMHKGLFLPRQWVLIGLNEGTEQVEAEIEDIDENIILFRHPLPRGKVPKPGDIVCRFLGWKKHYMDARKLEKATEVSLS